MDMVCKQNTASANEAKYLQILSQTLQMRTVNLQTLTAGRLQTMTLNLQTTLSRLQTMTLNLQTTLSRLQTMTLNLQTTLTVCKL